MRIYLNPFEDLIIKAQRPFSAVKVVKEISRERFAGMPKQRLIPNKKAKKPKYKTDYTKEE